MEGLLTLQPEANGSGLGRQYSSPACSRVSFMAAVPPVASSKKMNDMEDLKVAGFWSKLDDSDADADSAGSYGEIADKHRAALLEGKTEGDIPRTLTTLNSTNGCLPL